LMIALSVGGLAGGAAALAAYVATEPVRAGLAIQAGCLAGLAAALTTTIAVAASLHAIIDD
jgi:hypothetical protein